MLEIDCVLHMPNIREKYESIQFLMSNPHKTSQGNLKTKENMILSNLNARSIHYFLACDKIKCLMCRQRRNKEVHSSII